MPRIISEIKTLKHGDVSKKIIENLPKVRPHEDLLGPLDKYDEENYEIYCDKRRQFYETCKKYNRLNQDTFVCCKKRLDKDHRELLDLEFLTQSNKNNSLKTSESSFESDGKIERKRTERPIHQVMQKNEAACSLDPWFRRYLILNKFIHSSRVIIIRNRLQKNLEKLKQLDEDKIKKFENVRKSYNVSYQKIFEKFL